MGDQQDSNRLTIFLVSSRFRAKVRGEMFSILAKFLKNLWPNRVDAVVKTFSVKTKFLQSRRPNHLHAVVKTILAKAKLNHL